VPLHISCAECGGLRQDQFGLVLMNFERRAAERRGVAALDPRRYGWTLASLRRKSGWEHFTISRVSQPWL
jgi:hypothetical protein